MNSRKESSFNLGTAEQKLLYTLHWILSDAADECSLQAEEEGKLDISTFAYLFPLSAITVTLNMQYLKSKDVCIKVFVQHFANVYRIQQPIFSDLYLPFCTDLHQYPRVWFCQQLPPRKWKTDLACPLGVSSSRCRRIYSTRKFVLMLEYITIHYFLRYFALNLILNVFFCIYWKFHSTIFFYGISDYIISMIYK